MGVTCDPGCGPHLFVLLLPFGYYFPNVDFFAKNSGSHSRRVIIGGGFRFPSELLVKNPTTVTRRQRRRVGVELSPLNPFVHWFQ